MKIIVCIKQIPDTNDVKWSKDNNIIRDGVISILNPNDALAIQTALDIKKTVKNTSITLLTMGPDNSKNSLLEGLSMGADRAILLSDRKFSGADTNATSKTLYYAIKNVIKSFNLIITGQFAADGDTAQTPYSLATRLEIPVIGYVNKIDEIKENSITLTSVSDDKTIIAKAKFPLLIAVSKSQNSVYKPLIEDYIRAQEIKIETLNAEDIMADPEKTGMKGSPTYVSKAYRPENKRECQFIDDITPIIEGIKNVR